MEILWSILIFALGLGVLYVGAEGTIHGAVGIARRLGISSLLIGLTLIAYGTSAPELAIDVTAALRGKTDLAFGDLIGSNISNLGLILGIAVVIRPILLDTALVRFEIPLLVAQALFVWLLCWDGELSRFDGAVLLAMFLATACWTIYRGLREKQEFRKEVVQLTRDIAAQDPWVGLVASDEKSESEVLAQSRITQENAKPDHPGHESARSVPINMAMVLFGLFGLIVGAQMMVYGAVNIAQKLGVSELTIGLTIVAVGTSLPELATAILASRKRESDIVIGNVAGSNLFNLGGILGIVALIYPIHVHERTLRFELPMLIAFSAFLLPVAFTGREVGRRIGWIYLIAFLSFLGYQAFGT
ncbi:MAG: calcium/sodium antiporter [Pirellula sp.]|nr:calcium/sodium antiporter [Pirellula sp.]